MYHYVSFVERQKHWSTSICIIYMQLIVVFYSCKIVERPVSSYFKIQDTSFRCILWCRWQPGATRWSSAIARLWRQLPGIHAHGCRGGAGGSRPPCPASCFGPQAKKRACRWKHIQYSINVYLYIYIYNIYIYGLVQKCEVWIKGRFHMRSRPMIQTYDPDPFRANDPDLTIQTIIIIKNCTND